MSDIVLLQVAMLWSGILGPSASWTFAAEPVRVMSFNIRYDNPNDGDDAWPHRRDGVADMIRGTASRCDGTAGGPQVADR